jgi:hypothetical protein
MILAMYEGLMKLPLTGCEGGRLLALLRIEGQDTIETRYPIVEIVVTAHPGFAIAFRARKVTEALLRRLA